MQDSWLALNRVSEPMIQWIKRAAQRVQVLDDLIKELFIFFSKKKEMLDR